MEPAQQIFKPKGKAVLLGERERETVRERETETVRETVREREKEALSF